MKNKSIILLFSCFLCGIHSFAQTTVSGSFMFQSVSRSYRIYIPAVYNSSVAVPLVLNLHGYGSNNTQQEAYGDFRAIADTANFIIVHPNGTLDQYSQRYWNCFGGPSPTDDVGFLSALIDTVMANYTIDPDCIYSTGMSNGGFMSHYLADMLSLRIAAIASVTGSMTHPQLATCNPLHPTPVMQIHGTADATVPYNGDAFFAPVDSVVNFWVDLNHCNPTPVITNLPDVNTADGCTATHYVYSGGDSATTVEFYKINGGGHSWPGAIININTTNMDFSASVEIWRFFRKYKLNHLVNEVAENEAALLSPAYPNPSQGNFDLKFTDASERTITITDCLGNSVLTFTCAGSEAHFNLDAPGMYFLTISNGEKSSTQKIIKN